mmetsp:Transcript_14520/g.14129  ORF Transcript_14520/g.14129 Transcript_14520/m.14129 type:complete len:116 (-) Transcript_14520:764-1111(-)
MMGVPDVLALEGVLLADVGLPGNWSEVELSQEADPGEFVRFYVIDCTGIRRHIIPLDKPVILRGSVGVHSAALSVHMPFRVSPPVDHIVVVLDRKLDIRRVRPAPIDHFRGSVSI